ncbi:MAG: hypothetical protein QM608_16850 [Caulobacter sp.]
MKTIKSLLAGALILAAPTLAYAADGGSKKTTAVFIALFAVFCGVGTVFLAVAAGKAKKK